MTKFLQRRRFIGSKSLGSSGHCWEIITLDTLMALQLSIAEKINMIYLRMIVVIGCLILMSWSIWYKVL